MEVDFGRLLKLASYDSSIKSSSYSSIYCKAGQELIRGKHTGKKRGLHGLIGRNNAIEDLLTSSPLAIQKGLQSESADEIEIGGDVTFQHLGRKAFNSFRESITISNEEYCTSLSALNGGATQESGKSGSIFWFSNDNRYVIKSTGERDVLKLLAIIEDYTDHHREAKQAERLCLLPLFFGAYVIRAGSRKMFLVCMNNVFEGGVMPSSIYDLKGTTEDRYVKPAAGKVLKDINFGDSLIYFDNEKVELLHDAVHADSTFLESHDIMDYSLLVGIYDGAPDLSKSAAFSQEGKCLKDQDTEADLIETVVTFRVSFIDVLEEYGSKKKVAHVYKMITRGCCHEIDTVPPEYYQQRFEGCMTGIFTPYDE